MLNHDLTFETEKSFTPEELCTVLKEESQNRLKGVLAVSDIPLVSSDFNNETASCVFDSNHIIQIGNQTKILAWYDNEWGPIHCHTMQVSLFDCQFE